MDTESTGTGTSSVSARPEGPTPLPAYEMPPFRSTVVGAEIKIAMSTEEYMGTYWLMCEAHMTHQDGAQHEMRWRSRTLAMAMQMVQAMCTNYPQLSAMSLTVQL